MAKLVDKYFSEYDLKAIQEAVAKAESQSAGELAIKIASHSKDWLLERIIFSALFTTLCVVASLFFTREESWGVFYNYTQALFVAATGLVVSYLVFGVTFGSTSRKRQVVWNRALKLFHELKPTKGHTGVLIFVSLYERQAAVVADKAIAEKLHEDYWHQPHAMIMGGIKNEKHAEGIIKAIEEIGSQLALYFPHQKDDVNEMPDRPEIL